MYDAATVLERALGKSHLEQVVQGLERLQGFSAKLRLLMAVRPEHLDGGRIRWELIEARDLRQEVHLETLQQWLSKKPAFALVQRLGDCIDSTGPDPKAVVDALRDWPEGLSAFFFGLPRRLKGKGLESYAGAALGMACAGSRQGSGIDKNNMVLLERAGPEAWSSFLLLSEESLQPDELQILGHWLSGCSPPPEAARAAYVRALLRYVGTFSRQQALTDIQPEYSLLTGADVQALLQAGRKKARLFPHLLIQLAARGGGDVAPFFADMLHETKHIPIIILALALCGAEGQGAAQHFISQIKKPKPLLRQAVDAFLKIPAPEKGPLAAWQFNFPHYGRTVAEELASPEQRAWPTPHPHYPVPPLSVFSKVLGQLKLSSQDLSVHAWADALWLLVMDPWLKDPAWAYAQAETAGVLGRGGHPANLCEALDRLDFNCRVNANYTRDQHVGTLLQFCEATPVVWHHALGRFLQSPEAQFKGRLEDVFGRSLRADNRLGAQAFRSLLTGWAAMQAVPCWKGPPPQLKDLVTPAQEVEWEVPENYWLFVEVDSSQVEVMLQGLHLRLQEGRWQAGEQSGILPSLKPGPLTLTLDVQGPVVQVGVAGVWVATLAAPAQNTRLKLWTTAPFARVALYQKYLPEVAQAAEALLLNPTVETVTALAQWPQAEARWLLAVAAEVLEDSALRALAH